MVLLDMFIWFQFHFFWESVSLLSIKDYFAEKGARYSFVIGGNSDYIDLSQKQHPEYFPANYSKADSNLYIRMF